MSNTTAATKTISTPYGDAVLTERCAGCGNLAVIMAETDAESWAGGLHDGYCCRSTVPCGDQSCLTHNPM